MKGINIVTLNRESLREALQVYLSKQMLSNVVVLEIKSMRSNDFAHAITFTVQDEAEARKVTPRLAEQKATTA